MSSNWWPPPDNSYRGHFAAGFDKYVDRGDVFGAKPPPDVYWNPRAGGWQTYAVNLWEFVVSNAPQTNVNFASAADLIFDEITQQWSALPAQTQQTAVWDGRRHEWFLAHRRQPPPSAPKEPPPGHEEYERELEYFRGLLQRKLIEPEDFERYKDQLFDRFFGTGGH